MNGESIYGTRHWFKYGEGPTQFKGGSFIDQKAFIYAAEDIRFTIKPNAIALDWPGEELLVKSFSSLDAAKIKSFPCLVLTAVSNGR